MPPKRVQPRAGVEGGSARAKGKPRIWAAIVSKVALTRVVERQKNASNKYYSRSRKEKYRQSHARQAADAWGETSSLFILSSTLLTASSSRVRWAFWAG